MMDESKVGLTSKQKAGNFIGSFGLIIILLVIFGLFSFLIPGVYFTWVNLRDMIRFSSFVGIGAIGMTFCIMTGNFDISVGSMLALAGVLGASLAPRISGVGGVIVTIIVGLFLGFIKTLPVTASISPKLLWTPFPSILPALRK